ncbi:hypothetical protein ALO95_200358 [Pseudomonas syringae pv. antirrhini]|nr:hypothetical protein ALQ23_200313 [Pseudomonas syringae pv. antirrhini]RMW23500.1 hypothetical protein ALO95_200358 [Pseudomonas syringae pv. antirrhini]
MHDYFYPMDAAVADQISALRLRGTEHAMTQPMAVLGPARLSIGSVASQIALVRITATGLIERRHTRQHFRSASSLLAVLGVVGFIADAR